MIHETVVIGPLTRDFTRRDAAVSTGDAGVRWSQPGGAVWHAGLALVLASPLEEARVTVVATAGPWARRCGLPGLAAAGVECRGVESPRDTTFINRYDPDRRRQTLVSRAAPLPVTAVEAGVTDTPAVVVVSPLMPGDTPPGTARRMRDRGAFVAADAQGYLRATGAGGRIETRRVDLRQALDDAQAVKFSLREFRVWAGLGPAAEWRVAAARAAGALAAEVLVSLGGEGAALALPGEARVIDAPSPSLPGAADTTGAGDVLIAAYARARSLGLAPRSALERAVEETHALLRRRAEAERRAEGSLLPVLRELQRVAALTRRRVRRGEDCHALFRPGGALAQAVGGALRVGPPGMAADCAADRGAAISGVCWALFSGGWPDDPRLRAGALAALVAAEERGLRGQSAPGC
ncbi:MAG: PfkB family carbohydrate kinase [Chloroflexota bacterium]|nr:PfkB family carbohydrate kinase [Chloroflexota bacterium]